MSAGGGIMGPVKGSEGSMQEFREYELVRVAGELLTQLLEAESPPVVLVSAERQEDGTVDLVLRQVADHGGGVTRAA